MTFASDNTAGASHKVMEALAEANAGLAPAYGSDPWTARAKAALNDLFEREVAAVFVATGTAANSLALAHAYRPGGIVIAHTDSHIARDEASAPALFAPGLSLALLDGPDGRLGPATIEDALNAMPPDIVHHGRPVALSLTNTNEAGQSYSPDEVAAVAAPAKARGLTVHMDGARFFNALAFHGASAADMTWRAGVDVLALGLTKVGGWCAEMVVFFNAAAGAEIAFRQKQSAMLLSKHRFAAAQVIALLGDGHALALADHANRHAAEVSGAFAASPSATLAWPSQSNEVFAYLAPAASERLAAAGIAAYPWASHSRHVPPPPAPDWRLHRFVTSHATTSADIAALARALDG